MHFHDRGYKKRSNDMMYLFLADALNYKLSMGNLFPTKYDQYNTATSPLGNPEIFPAIIPNTQSL
jgi:hypothetical protein